MYFGNQIAEIRDLNSTNQVNYVNAQDNSADHGLRGISATYMTEKSLWLQGSQFVLSSSDNWKKDEQHEIVFLNSAEQKTQGTRRQPIDQNLIHPLSTSLASGSNPEQLSSKWKTYERKREHKTDRS